MIKVKKTLDINAHITNVKCRVETDAYGPKAVITFDNLDYGVVTAVKFYAKGYNAFNDIVPVYGKDDFLLIVQDIRVFKNTSSSDITIRMQNYDMKRIELQEYQICFDDGRILTYEGKNEVEFELEEFYTIHEMLEREALRNVFDPRVTYNLLESEHGWVCTCGRLNSSYSEACSLCYHTKNEVKWHLSEAGRKNATEKHKELLVKRSEAESAKEKTKNNAALAISAVVVIIVLLIIAIASCGGSDKDDTKTTYNNSSYSSNYSSNYSSSYESVYTALQFSNIDVEHNSLYTVCTGTITNKGSRTYKFVEVKGSFKNSSGTVLDTDWTYAVGSEGLAPGESKTFRMSVDKNYSISKCSVTILDYN